MIDLSLSKFYSFLDGGWNLDATFLMWIILKMWFGIITTYEEIINPFFCKTYFDKGIIYLNDSQFDVNNVRSYASFKQKWLNSNILTWVALILLFLMWNQQLLLPPHIG